MGRLWLKNANFIVVVYKTAEKCEKRKPFISHVLPRTLIIGCLLLLCFLLFCFWFCFLQIWVQCISATLCKGADVTGPWRTCIVDITPAVCFHTAARRQVTSEWFLVQYPGRQHTNPMVREKWGEFLLALCNTYHSVTSVWQSACRVESTHEIHGKCLLNTVTCSYGLAVISYVI